MAAKAAGSLQARGFASQQRAAAGEIWDGYWVYIGGVADVATADRIFKTLDRSGIKDAQLMPEPAIPIGCRSGCSAIAIGPIVGPRRFRSWGSRP